MFPSQVKTLILLKGIDKSFPLFQLLEIVMLKFQTPQNAETPNTEGKKKKKKKKNKNKGDDSLNEVQMKLWSTLNLNRPHWTL